jgi:FG-GAP-like repeat
MMHLTSSRQTVRALFALTLAVFWTIPSITGAQTTVRFQDKTSSTGLVLQSNPAGAAALEASGDNLLDLQVHYLWSTTNDADFFGSQPIVNGLPSWNNDSIPFYGSARPGPGTKAPLSLDYDNDGLMDGLVVSESGVTLYRGTGTGFTDVTASVALLDAADAACAGDYDSDGWTDVAIQFGVETHLWRNLGKDSSGAHLGFTLDQTLTASYHVTWAGDMVWFDIDADGDLDLFIADLSGGPTGGPGGGSGNELFLNSGTNPPTFTETTLPPLLRNALLTESIAVADILYDMSGYYPEIVLSGSRPDLYKNNAGTLQFSSSASAPLRCCGARRPAPPSRTSHPRWD